MSYLLIPVVMLVLWAAWVFNRLVRLRNLVRTAWSDIDVQLTRRHDLVPLLVEAVRGYAGHERALLDSVAALRSEAVAQRSPAKLASVESALEQGLSRLIALREAYPDLKASANFVQLQRDLVDVEDHLQYARRFYNGAVRGLNDAIQRFPDVLLARPLGFVEAEFYAAESQARAAPTVEGLR